ncbi:MAG: L-aspartate oxidase, partial [Terriglobales bacterium]
VRDGAELCRWLEALRARAAGERPATALAEIETANLAAVAAAITAAALAREESRGAHFRSDFARPRPELAGIHSWQRQGQVRLGPPPGP